MKQLKLVLDRIERVQFVALPAESRNEGIVDEFGARHHSSRDRLWRQL